MTTLSRAVAVLALAGLCACATQPRASSQPDPVGAAFQQPMRDLSLIRDVTPAPLQAAVLAPYGLEGAEDCAGLATQLAALDTALGPDVDVLVADKATASGLAGDLIGGVFGLPYRGVVRTITGAARRDRAMKVAILAGMVRRGFLKGRQGLICAPVARPPQQAVLKR